MKKKKRERKRKEEDEFINQAPSTIKMKGEFKVEFKKNTWSREDEEETVTCKVTLDEEAVVSLHSNSSQKSKIYIYKINKNKKEQNEEERREIQ